MTLSTLERSPEQEDSRDHVRPLAETVVDAPSLDEKTPEDFQYEANDFFRQEKQLRQSFIDQRHPTPGDAARAALYQDRIQSAEFRELGELSDILFSSPLFAALQDFLSSATQKLRGEDLGPTERAQLKTQIKEAKRGCVVFNHKLRDFLLENSEHIQEVDMAQWLAKAMGGKERTARTTLAGIGAEVAAARMIRDAGVVVEPSTIDQDLHRIDFTIHRADGRRLALDIKSGGNQGGDGYMGANLELDIERHMHENFTILPEFRASLLRSIDIA